MGLRLQYSGRGFPRFYYCRPPVANDWKFGTRVGLLAQGNIFLHVSYTSPKPQMESDRTKERFTHIQLAPPTFSR
eukprot:205050-Rhodomonas_salina.2